MCPLAGALFFARVCAKKSEKIEKFVLRCMQEMASGGVLEQLLSGEALRKRGKAPCVRAWHICFFHVVDLKPSVLRVGSVSS